MKQNKTELYPLLHQPSYVYFSDTNSTLSALRYILFLSCCIFVSVFSFKNETAGWKLSLVFILQSIVLNSFN